MLSSYNQSSPAINSSVVEQDTSFVSDFQLIHYVHKSMLKSLVIKDPSELNISKSGDRFLKLSFTLPEKITPLMLFQTQFKFEIFCALNFKDVLSAFEPSFSSQLDDFKFNFDDVIEMPYYHNFYVKSGGISLINDVYQVKGIDSQLLLKNFFLHTIQHLDYILHKTNNSLAYKQLLFKILDNINKFQKIGDYTDVFLKKFKIVLIPNLYREVL